MKICFLFFLLLANYAFAQKRPTQAEMNKMKQQMEAELKKMEKEDPEIAKMMKQAMETSKKVATSTPASQKTTANPDIKTVPKRPLTQTEITNRLKSEQVQLKKQISPALLQKMQETISASGSAPNSLDNAAAAKFYAGSLQEAILMQIQACQKDSNDLLGLNNLAAMYNLTGQEIKALPLLRTLVSQLPRNSIVLNNLGQCYMGLNQKDSALLYLNKCIAVEPHHPEANKTAAAIMLSKGNKEAAGKYLESSLSGAFTLSAAQQYKALFPDKAVGRFVRPRTKFPDYFNENKYDLPPQCESVDSVDIVRQLHENFKNRLDQLIDKYKTLQTLEGQLASDQLKKAAGISMKTGKPFATRPFTVSAGFMMMDYMIDRGFREEAMIKFRMNREAEIDSLREEYRVWGNKSMTCDERNYLTNLYLKKVAIIRRDIQEKRLQLEKETFNEVSYWSYLSAPDEHSANAAFYGSVVQYLTALESISKTWFESGCHEGNAYPSENNFDDAARLPDCPIDINIPFIIGNLELNCKNFKLKVGAGITTGSDDEKGPKVEDGVFFTYEKDFESKESTMSLGVSLGFEQGKGPVKGGIEAKEALYITFDENNHVMDAGLEFSANAEASARFAAGKKYLATGLETDIKAEAGFGYKIGINSGWTFTDPNASIEGFDKKLEWKPQQP